MNGVHFNGNCRFDKHEWAVGLNELIDKDYKYWSKSNNFLQKKQWIILKKCIK